MTAADLGKTLAGGLLGAVLGWSANALTLQGRVHALEAGQTAIVQRLDALLSAKGVPVPEQPREATR